MADAAFDRVVINTRERPISTDINQLLSQDARTVREILRSLFLPHPSNPQLVGTSFQPVSGFLGDGLFVTANGSLAMTVNAGLGMLYDAGSIATGIGSIGKVDDLAPYFPAYLSANETLNLPAAPPGGQERVDIIEVKLDRRLQDSSSRGVLNTVTGVFDPTLLNKILAYSLDGRTGQVNAPANSTTGLSIKAGINQAAGTYAASNGVTGVPTTSPGYTKLATILVPTGGVVTQGEVRDERFLLAPNGVHNWGFNLLQVPGTPDDTLTFSNFPPASSGFRFAAHQTTSPSNGGTIRCYVFAGRNGSFGAAVTAHAKGATVAVANRLVRQTDISVGSVTSAIKASLVAGGSTNFSAAIGQEFLTWDMDATRLIDVGDSVGTNRLYHVMGMCSPR